MAAKMKSTDAKKMMSKMIKKSEMKDKKQDAAMMKKAMKGKK